MIERGICMFIRTVRAGTLRTIAIAFLCVLTISALFFLTPHFSGGDADAFAAQESREIRFDKIKTDADRVAFLKSFGYTVEEAPTECVEVTVPKDFDKVFAAYNELQKACGLDLGRYRGKTVTRYTYKVKDYPGYDGEVLANLLIYKNKVIGGDVCSADPAGFAKGLC